MSGLERASSRDLVRMPRFSTRNFVVGTTAITLGCVAMALVAAGVGAVYQKIAYDWLGSIGWHAGLGAIAGLFYAVPFLARGEYTIPAYLASGRRPQRVFMSWNAAFLGLLVLAFMTQTTASVSRVSAVLFYVIGLIVMIGLETVVRRAVVAGLRNGSLAPRRVMLVGRAAATRAFMARLDAAGREEQRTGVRVVAVTNIPERSEPNVALSLEGALERAVSKARSIMPDDIVIVAPWDDETVIDTAVGAFEKLPVAIHLDVGGVVSRYHDVHVRRVGGASTLSVAEVPLSTMQSMAKRAFDLVGAGVGLIVALPLFALIALLIKLDSRGPVFFRQDRLGFNQARFSIWKFRTMTVTENDADLQQARKNDPRITRVGAILRKTSLDELPQLMNVLSGEMSLVGPRPHAVAHDRDFERRINRYPRRLNMKPGITGWAQVNGFRGETNTDAKMQDRVEADLYYIDNWSLMFDAYIVLLTVVSPKVFRNAR